MKQILNLPARLNVVILGFGLLLAGCAQFQHQTAESEPHALVTIAQPENYPGPHGAVQSFDGLPVSAGKTYRVKPGTHAVVVQHVETVVQSGSPVKTTLFQVGNAPMPPDQPATVYLSQSGGMSVTGQQPFAVMQSANLSVEDHRTRTTTRSITVKAGWQYELTGNFVIEKPFTAQ